MFKKLLGISPTQAENGAFSPSPLALKLATTSKTDYDNSNYPNAYKGNLKIAVICTEERDMTMANGKKFSTGNHPVELLLPMLHLKKAGFNFDIFTPTGQSVKLEMWAMPNKDKAVLDFYETYKSEFDKPKSLNSFVKNTMPTTKDYAAVFIPGGHGAMLGLPENNDLANLLKWANTENLFTLSICHGPAALLAANLNADTFIYDGYKIAAFPHSVDKQTPMIGYMPGQMPWNFNEKLKNLGVTIVNSKADATCHVDRKLITAASPKAANNFGKLAANELLKVVN